MNPAEKRKQIGQVVILVVLLAVLGVSMTVMLQTVNRSRSGAPATTAQPAATAAPAAQTTGMAATESSAGAGQPAAAGDATVADGVPVEFNPNVFKVFSLNPPKNPFLQEERWYTEELTAGLPGYPEMRDSGFFETLEPGVPGLESLLEEDESWRQISIEKIEADREYSVSGTSEDGQIKTRMTYTGRPGRRVDIEWDHRSGVPVSALADMDWQDALPQTVPEDLGENGDLFNAPDGGLTVPGMDGLFSDGGTGQLLLCQGVSGEGSQASALVIYNETPRIVQAGDSLPPRYIVDTITEDGVILLDLKDNETTWLPIGGRASMGGGTASGVRAPAGGQV